MYWFMYIICISSLRYNFKWKKKRNRGIPWQSSVQKSVHSLFFFFLILFFNFTILYWFFCAFTVMVWVQFLVRKLGSKPHGTHTHKKGLVKQHFKYDPKYIYIYIYFIEIQLIYNVVLVSGVQQIEIYMFIFRFFPIVGYYKILSILCYTEGMIVIYFIYCCGCLITKSCLTLL